MTTTNLNQLSTSLPSPKQLFLVCLGTFIEWAEYVYYGYLVFFLSTIFLPEKTQTSAVVITFAIMAGGYLMRPLGAILFGYIGDRQGRTIALYWSMLLMATATLLIGLLPPYQMIGIWAPIGLLLSRLIQGLALGGEFNGACIYLIESSKNRPHLYSSFAMLTSVLGMVVGGFCAGVVQQPDMPEWAFRVPFLIGGISAIIGVYLRSKQPKMIRAVEAPLITLLAHHKLATLKVAIAGAFIGVFVYIGNVYYVTFLIKVAHVPKTMASFIAMYGEGIVLIGLPLCALYCDKYNPTQFFRLALLSTFFFSPFIFSLSLVQNDQTPNIMFLLLGQTIFGILNSMVSAPVMKWVFDKFPASIRYTGVSLGWGLGVALLGGFSPLLASLAQEHIHPILGPSLLIMLTALILFGATFSFKYLNPSTD